MKPKFKYTLVALAVGLTAASAHADWNVDTSGGVQTHKNNFNSVSKPDGFETIKKGGSFSYSFDVINPDSNIDLDFWFSALRKGSTVSLWNGTDALIDLSLGTTVRNGERFGNSNPGAGGKKTDDFFSLSLGSLAAGNYSLIFNTASNSKIKVDDIKLAVAPIPEPESYAMFLAGLALMGIVAARRARS